ncbi:hypothetical protein M440DRAFT_1396212, partial [Trichoderma longibrachiatum ATCC 18648]
MTPGIASCQATSCTTLTITSPCCMNDPKALTKPTTTKPTTTKPSHGALNIQVCLHWKQDRFSFMRLPT